MPSKSIVLLSLAVVTLLSIGGTVTAQEKLSPAISTQVTPTFSFGMIGLGTGETARLNAVNVVRTPLPVAIAIAQVPCKVELDLYDGQGKLIKQKTIANLAFGQADFLDAARSEIPTTATHVGLSGVVKVMSSQSYFCNVSTTLEVFDNVTGATTAILANPSSSQALIFAGFSPTLP